MPEQASLPPPPLLPLLPPPRTGWALFFSYAVIPMRSRAALACRAFLLALCDSLALFATELACFTAIRRNIGSAAAGTTARAQEWVDEKCPHTEPSATVGFVQA